MNGLFEALKIFKTTDILLDSLSNFIPWGGFELKRIAMVFRAELALLLLLNNQENISQGIFFTKQLVQPVIVSNRSHKKVPVLTTASYRCIVIKCTVIGAEN
jgi:hypothetical protein